MYASKRSWLSAVTMGGAAALALVLAAGVLPYDGIPARLASDAVVMPLQTPDPSVEPASIDSPPEPAYVDGWGRAPDPRWSDPGATASPDTTPDAPPTEPAAAPNRPGAGETSDPTAGSDTTADPDATVDPDATAGPGETAGPDGAAGPDGLATEPATATSPPRPTPTATRAPILGPPQPDTGNGIETEGTLLVPSDVQPGTYQATVPEDSIICSWVRLSGTSGELEETLIATGIGQAGDQVVVTIEADDAAFRHNGCGDWTRIG